MGGKRPSVGRTVRTHDKYYPEIAVPLELVPKFKIAPGQNQAVWADIYIPKGAPAGIYRGTVSVSANGSIVRDVPVQLTVRKFTLPDSPSAKTMLCFSSSDINKRVLGEDYINPGTAEGAKASLVRDQLRCAGPPPPHLPDRRRRGRLRRARRSPVPGMDSTAGREPVHRRPRVRGAGSQDREQRLLHRNLRLVELEERNARGYVGAHRPLGRLVQEAFPFHRLFSLSDRRIERHRPDRRVDPMDRRQPRPRTADGILRDDSSPQGGGRHPGPGYSHLFLVARRSGEMGPPRRRNTRIRRTRASASSCTTARGPAPARS